MKTDRVTLDDVRDRLEFCTKYSNYLAARCPFHDDQSPSLLVYEDGFRCQACGAHGSLEFLAKKLGARIASHPYSKAFSWTSWLNRYGDYGEIAEHAHQTLLKNPAQGKYLRDRKIESAIQLGCLGWLDAWYTFPVYDKKHSFLGLTIRASPTIQTKLRRYEVSKGLHGEIYVPNWQRVLESEKLYVVFGIFDSWSLELSGLPVVTGLTGQSFPADQLDQFRKPIYIIPDRGEESKGIELQTKLGWRGHVIRLPYHDDLKDPADFYRYEHQEMMKTISNSS